MITATAPANETARLAALRDLGALGAAPDQALEPYVKLVAKLLDVPIALVSLIDEARQWFIARHGLEIVMTPRDVSFCAHAILQDDVLTIVDTLEDPRFRDNPLVLEAPSIRAYAGAPIVIGEGFRIGTVCAIDRRSRDFTSDQLDTLRQLAKLIAQSMSLQKAAREHLIARARLEEAQRFSDRATVLIETMSDGVVLHDRTGAVIQANPSACRLLGLTPDQLLGVESIDPRWRAFSEEGAPIRGEDHPSMVVLRTGRPVTDFVMGLDLVGLGVRWLQIFAHPLFEMNDGVASHAMVTFSDITALKAQEQDLRRLHAEAQIANNAKSTFLANMSHEIRTPLNGVVGVAGALARTDLNPRQRDMVGLIQTSGRTLERLLSDILDLSKIETGRMELEIAPFLLQEVVESAANLMRVRADEAGIAFIIEYAPGLGPTYLGDGIRLRQVISNLVSNAVKFTTKGEVRIHVRPHGPDGVEIEVSDTGIGFDEVSRDALFSRFSQADPSITRRFGGSGLGLAISKALVNLMGGDIFAHGRLGVGATFTIRIPLVKCESPAGEQFAGANDALLALPPKLRILVAEDSAINRRVMKLMLEPLGLSADFVENGAEAVRQVEVNPFDVIFMDMQMPEMDGLSATRAIRQREHILGAERTPIIMLTANASDKHRQMAIDAGADLHLPKPVTIEALHSALVQCLNQAPLNS